jgi:hypothetical protein
MPRSFPRNTLVCLTFAALLTVATAVSGAPGPAQWGRSAGQATAIPAATAPAEAWMWLRTVLATASCILDPSGSQRRPGGPRPDVGCILDPSGHCRPDVGCILDPDGHCRVG